MTLHIQTEGNVPKPVRFTVSQLTAATYLHTESAPYAHSSRSICATSRSRVKFIFMGQLKSEAAAGEAGGIS